MLFVYLKENDPFYCLAAEEYLLKNSREAIFLLWQSHDTIVVGKHQNALAEVNYPFVREHNIRIARRISGGGTVFHDAGNVNFAFIQNVGDTTEINFRTFTRPVVEALTKLNIPAVHSEGNDLLSEGKKISGNAQHIFKKRVLHHGTLLFSADLNKLRQSLKVTPGRYIDKAVQSRRSSVTNIAPLLRESMTPDQFISFLAEDHLKKPGNSLLSLGKEDVLAIERLATEKFKTWEWNFGYSPKYTFKNELNLSGKSLQIDMDIRKGKIIRADLQGSWFSKEERINLISRLEEKRHSYEAIRQSLHEAGHKAPDKLVYTFF